ncbi:MAG: cupin domain-containing protein [Gammaproteobacteria bacterium]|nr:cupin domain-containing protein [Gammaproteobacteria bacterium]
MLILKPSLCSAILVTTMGITSFGVYAGDKILIEGGPTKHQGFNTVKKQEVDLDGQIPGMEGRKLRVRLLTIDPGGHIKSHSHKNRPAAFYVISGATTVTYEDGTTRRFPAGTTGYATVDTVHYHRNNENEPAVFVAADIIQPKKK